MVFDFTVNEPGLYSKWVGCYVPISVQNIPLGDAVVMSIHGTRVRLSVKEKKGIMFMGLIPNLVGLNINGLNKEISDVVHIVVLNPIIAYLNAEESGQLVYDPTGLNPAEEIKARREEISKDVLAHKKTHFYSVEDFTYAFNEDDLSDQGLIVVTDEEVMMRRLADQNKEEMK